MFPYQGRLARRPGGGQADPARRDVITAVEGTDVKDIAQLTEQLTALVSALGTLFVTAGALISLRWFQQLP